MTKLKIKIGNLELEYEGPEEFLKAELPELLKGFSSLVPAAAAIKPAGGGAGNGVGGGAALPELGTSSIAAKLNVDSGPSLATAAAAQLTFVQGKSVFTRAEILAEMKKATGYFNANYVGNLSKILAGLVKEQALVIGAAGAYSLGAQKKTALEQALAG